MYIKTFNQPDSFALASLEKVKLNKNLELYFPFLTRSKQGLPRYRLHELDQHFANSDRENTYRVCFSPVTVMLRAPARDFSDYLMDKVDLCLGQETVKRLPCANYYRLPAWCLRLFGLMPTIAEIQAKINELEALRKANPFNRKEFLGCVINKDNVFFAQGSIKVFKFMAGIDPYLKHLPLKFAGNFGRNDLRLQEQYQGDKIAYLQNFTFNLCPEFINLHSVVSENIAICLEAGCIPVYWGDIDEDLAYFNPKAMLLYQVNKRTEISQQFREILVNPDKFIQENIFQPQAATLIYKNIYAPIIAKIEKDLDIDLLDSKQFVIDRRVDDEGLSAFVDSDFIAEYKARKEN
ncbi:hypothetical protein CKF54_02515 [Psittacicella hinzii]|uniref:Glycosyltransferase family 10 (Fucosyltransferase) C-term n=1 Tax=Psittacicella hinzii TaxID=2028575 RepID=A0A3A1Y5S7_9GAMM|nr:hypothetical protein [Psittacicella hinzii]RIY33612.1 hypothetical protein CKF54_02515 [Psittacicella hinzii]